jgi:chromosome segregation ATPase
MRLAHVSPDRSINFKLVERVCDLQRALDQALLSLQELQEQEQDWQFLEAQLAKTESFANVQQQAIAQLQLQLVHDQQQRQVLQELTLTLLMQQQVVLERLRINLQQSQAEVHAYLSRLAQLHSLAPEASQHASLLESEVFVARSLAVSLGVQLEASCQQLEALDFTIERYHSQVAAVERLSDVAEAVPELVSVLKASGKNSNHRDSPDDDQGSLVAPQAQTTDAKQTRIEALEAALAEQFQIQTRLKHRCQELGAERDRYQQQLQAMMQAHPNLHQQVLH